MSLQHHQLSDNTSTVSCEFASLPKQKQINSFLPPKRHELALRSRGRVDEGRPRFDSRVRRKLLPRLSWISRMISLVAWRRGTTMTWWINPMTCLTLIRLQSLMVGWEASNQTNKINFFSFLPFQEEQQNNSFWLLFRLLNYNNTTTVFC